MAINPLSASLTQGTSATGQVGRGHHHHGNRDQFLADAASVIGIDTNALKAQLQQGKSIADIAASKGITMDQLKAGLTDKVKARLAADVSSGKITQTQSDNILGRITAGMDNLLNRVAQGAMVGRAGGGDRDNDGDAR
jgi:hypothetical protein